MFKNILVQAKRLPDEQESILVLKALEALIAECKNRIRQQHDSNAMVLLAIILGCDKGNEDEVVELLEESLGLGNSNAAVWRAGYYMTQGGKAYFDAAEILLKRAITQKNPHAMAFYAYYWLSRQNGCAEDARNMLYQAIDLGNAYAMIIWARDIKQKDLPLSKAYLGKAALLDNPTAVFEYVNAIFEGDDKEEQKKSHSLIEKAFALGNAKIFIFLLQQYENEYPNDRHELLERRLLAMIERAVKLDIDHATLMLASIYSVAIRVPKDLPQALALAERVYRKNSATAGLFLSERMYQETIVKDALELINSISLDSKVGVQSLLNLVWSELIRGCSFTRKTIEILQQHAKQAILERLSCEGYAESHFFLQTLRANPTHPIVVILNHGDKKELKTLMSLSSERAAKRYFLANQFFTPATGIAVPEIIDSILANAEPGLAMDALIDKDSLRLLDKTFTAMTKHIQRILENAKQDKPWSLGWGGSKYCIQYDEKWYEVPKGVFKIYQILSKTGKTHVELEQIREILHTARGSANELGAFAQSVFGCARSDDTSLTYAALSLRIEQYDKACADNRALCLSA